MNNLISNLDLHNSRYKHYKPSTMVEMSFDGVYKVGSNTSSFKGSIEKEMDSVRVMSANGARFEIRNMLITDQDDVCKVDISIVNAHTHTHAYIHTCIHTYTHTCIHT